MTNTGAATSLHELTAARDTALAGARSGYMEANPQSAARFEAACTVMPGGNTRTVLFNEPFPLAIARGEGCRLWDADGHEYVDFLGEYTAGLYGHSDPVIRAAVERALDAGLSLSGHNFLEPRLASALCERFGLDLVRFTNSGTEANLMALATATVVTGRRKVLVFDGAYHGGVLQFATGGVPSNVPHEFVVAPYNDVDQVAVAFQRHGDELAAVLVEPMLGSGGCIPGSAELLHALRALTERHGSLLIFDEVMTSRLGPGGRQGELGLRPDLTTLGKYLGGGMSFGAFGGRADLMQRYDPRRPDALPHAGTFNNNTVTMSAGLAGLTERFTPAAATTLNARGDALRARLNALCRDAGVGMQFTGLGSLLAAQFTAGEVRSAADLRAQDDRLRALFFFDMLRRGVYLGRRGMVALSLVIGDREAALLCEAVAAFVGERALLLCDA